MFAYIPARIGSKRLPKKNIKKLGDKPVIEHVIRNLAALDEIKGIAVSTDSEEVVQVVRDLPKVVTLGLRDQKLSGDLASFQDLIREDLPRYQKHFGGESVLFATATCALVPPETFQNGLDSFKKNGSKGLVISVTPYEPSSYLTLTEESNGEVKVWFPDHYLMPTKDLPKTFYDSGCFYILNLKQFQETKIHTLFDLKPVRMVPLSSEMGIDVDNPEDWERLEKAFSKAHTSKPEKA